MLKVRRDDVCRQRLIPSCLPTSLELLASTSDLHMRKADMDVSNTTVG